MIAKLIVRAPNREAALQKMTAALEAYEVGGPVTNIEFLKRICVSPAFIAGEVETGYIDKYRSELFEQKAIPKEAFAQAAIALLLQERQSVRKLAPGHIPFSPLGGSLQQRSFNLAELPADGQTKTEPYNITIREDSPDKLSVTVDGTTYNVTTSNLQSSKFTSWFSHTRLETTMIRDESRITIWQLGKQYRFQLVSPPWIEKALGVKDVTHSVLAPMPCKVLRVEVKAGDEVKKDQIIAVIESMKMETVIRSPKDAVISRVVHVPGVSLCCDASHFHS
jgi:3-methylcrotonyl-CoA carboxylase alpha subunit